MVSRHHKRNAIVPDLDSKPTKRPLNRRILNTSASILVNTVTAAGVFARDWPVGTGLALYWGETFITGLALVAVIAIWSYGAGSSMIGSTVGATLLFNIVYLVFLIVIVGFVLPRHSPSEAFEWRPFGEGILLIGVLVLIHFAIASIGIRGRSELEIEDLAAPYLKRVLVLHFGIIVGMAALAALNKPRAVFGGFTVVKALVDLIGSSRS